MNLFPFYPKAWRDPKHICMADFSAEVSTGPGSAETEPRLPELSYDPSKKTLNEQWAVIEERYGQNAYDNIITAYVDKLMPASQSDHKAALRKNSLDRYMQAYRGIRREFMTEVDDLEDKFEDAAYAVQFRTRSELAILKSAVDGSRPLAEFRDTMPAPENKDDVMDFFERYLGALNGRYFNADVNEGVKLPSGSIPLLGIFIHGTDIFKGREYNSKAGTFQDNMLNWVEARVEWMLNKDAITAADLTAFQNEIAARYESYARLDGDASIISGADLKVLEIAANPRPDTLDRMLNETDEKVIKRLEIIQLMNPDAWEEVVALGGQTVIQAALNSGAENEFTAQMKKYGPVEDFSDAKDKFEDRLEAISKVGVKETLDFLREFNTGVHGDVLQYERSVRPPSLTTLVNKQMDYLLNGILTPEKDTDRMLVRFMTSNRKGRSEILNQDSSRDTLFRAIREATDSYQQKYEVMAGRIPDEISKIRTNPRIEDPTFHDRAAQLHALIILGNQAKVIVSRLERTPEHAGKKYIEQIDAIVPPDPASVRTGLRFKSAQPRRVGYRSNLELGGFNGRDLALKGAKVLGALTVVANMAQSYSETHGDFVDRVFQTVEAAATNQGVLAGAAITVGAHMAERDPRFLRYPWLSEHERAGTMMAFKLDNIGARVGYKEMTRFLNNNAEWRAVADSSMDPAQIKEMLKEAAKRTPPGAHPILAVSDLRKVIQNESILSALTTGGNASRMRYLFYSKFFASAVKPDVNHMKQLCCGSSYIALGPISIG